MTKGTGQKHYRPEDYEHAAHQADAEHCDSHDAATKAKSIERATLYREATGRRVPQERANIRRRRKA